MGDDDNGEAETNQASITMAVSAAEGMSGADITVTVKGGEGENVSHIEDVAKRRFEQAADEADCTADNRSEYQ